MCNLVFEVRRRSERDPRSKFPRPLTASYLHPIALNGNLIKTLNNSVCFDNYGSLDVT